MKNNVQIPLPPMAITNIDPTKPAGSTTVDQALTLLNQSVAELGYTLDALEVEMGIGRAYIHKVLQAEKPLSYRFIVALPDDLERLFEAKRAASLGLIVVAPVSGEQAAKNLISGLLGVLMAKAS